MTIKNLNELLDINKDVNIHQEHIRILALEVFKSTPHVDPEFIWSYFNENTIPYNLRNMEIDYYYHHLLSL